MTNPKCQEHSLNQHQLKTLRQLTSLERLRQQTPIFSSLLVDLLFKEIFLNLAQKGYGGIYIFLSNTFDIQGFQKRGFL